MKHHRKAVLIIGRVLFMVYLTALFYFLFFAEMLGRDDLSQHFGYAYNLELFKEIRRFLMNEDKVGWRVVFLNIYGNIIMFIPFGFFLPALFRRVRSFITVSILTLGTSLMIEVIQLVFRVGSFDVDDLLLNTVGGMAGYLCYRLMYPLIKKYL